MFLSPYRRQKKKPQPQKEHQSGQIFLRLALFGAPLPCLVPSCPPAGRWTQTKKNCNGFLNAEITVTCVFSLFFSSFLIFNFIFILCPSWCPKLCRLPISFCFSFLFFCARNRRNRARGWGPKESKQASNAPSTLKHLAPKPWTAKPEKRPESASKTGKGCSVLKTPTPKPWSAKPERRPESAF